MAEFIRGGCVGEDGCKPRDPRPCRPLGNEADQWDWGWAGGYKTSLEGLFILCNKSLGM